MTKYSRRRNSKRSYRKRNSRKSYRKRNSRKSYRKRNLKRSYRKRNLKRSYRKRNLRGGMEASPTTPTEGSPLPPDLETPRQAAVLLATPSPRTSFDPSKLETHIQELHNKIDLLANVVINHGPGEENPKRKWGPNAFRKLQEYWGPFLEHYYKQIWTEGAPNDQTLKIFDLNPEIGPDALYENPIKLLEWHNPPGSTKRENGIGDDLQQ